MNKSQTKRALLMSVISMLLCCTMLIGTTFAWFTDSVESGINTIVAGNLDVELYHSNGDVTNKKVDKGTMLFELAKWEPGVVAYENLTVKNEGSLALKYELSINALNATFVNGVSLADALKVAVVEGGFAPATEGAALTREDVLNAIPADKWVSLASFAETGKLYSADDTANTPSEVTYGIAIYWLPTDNDNVFNMNNKNKGKVLSIDLGVKLFATQLEAESDSFGDDYDSNIYKDLFANGGEIEIKHNYFVDNEDMIAASVIDEDATVNFGNSTITLDIPGATAATENWVGLRVTEGTVVFNGENGGIKTAANGELYAVVVGSNTTSAALTINGGRYVGGTTAVQVTQGTLTINGGFFACQVNNPGYLLNCLDGNYKNETAKIVVTGGTFVNFNPADNRAEGANTNFVADGYKVLAETQANGDVWYTVVKDIEIDENAKTVKIFTAENLLTFAEMVNGANARAVGQSFKGYTVTLENDIDLANKPWTPIGQTGATQFAGTFDGNGKTILNMNVDASAETGNYASGLFGWVETGATIKGVTLENATVLGHHYVGGIAGYMSSSATVDTCKVVGSKIIASAELIGDSWDNGDKVGGIAGFVNGGNTINNCTVENSTVQGYRDIGGIVGYAHGVVTNNTVKNITLNVDKAHNYKNYTDDKEFDCNTVIGESTQSTVNENNTVDGEVQVVKKEMVATAKELRDILNNAGVANAGNTVITIEADIILSDAWTPITIDGYNGADIVTIEGNGHTIKGLTAPLLAGGFAGGSGIVIKNLTIADSTIVSAHTTGSGAFVECADSMDVVTLNNCHLVRSTVTSTNSESRTGALVGYATGYAGKDGPVFATITIEGCSVVDCEVVGNSSVAAIIGHAGANVNTKTVIKKCTVKNTTITSNKNGDYRVGVVVGTANGGNVIISEITSEGNTVSQPNATTAKVHDLVGRFALNGTGIVTLDGVEIK